MYCFPLIKLVLDELYNKIPSIDDAEKADVICHELEKLSNDYQMLCKGGSINYNNPAARFAYTYGYVASHADVICQIISNNRVTRELFRSSEIKIVCLGGGPGSDLLGILKFMRLEDISAKLTCHIYDREELWQQCIESITQNIKVFTTNNLGVEPTIYGTVFFKKADIVESIDEIVQEGISGANILTMSFLLSELKPNEVRKVFIEIFDKISPGCILIMLDNASGNAHNELDLVVGGYNAYNSFFNSIELIVGTRKTFNVDWREDKQDLEPYRSKIKRDPRLKLPVHYRIYRKL